jgi:hypothetical protein
MEEFDILKIAKENVMRQSEGQMVLTETVKGIKIN